MTLTKRNKHHNRGLPSLFETLFRDDIMDVFPEFIGTSHMNKGFPSLVGTLHMNKGIPAVNIKETDKFYGIELAAPGLSKEDINVNLADGLLTISSETKSEENEEEDGYTYRGFSYASFSRSFTLPEDADGENISAKYEDGILKLELPKIKVAEKSPTKIDVL